MNKDGIRIRIKRKVFTREYVAALCRITPEYASRLFLGKGYEPEVVRAWLLADAVRKAELPGSVAKQDADRKAKLPPLTIGQRDRLLRAKADFERIKGEVIAEATQPKPITQADLDKRKQQGREYAFQRGSRALMGEDTSWMHREAEFDPYGGEK